MTTDDRRLEHQQPHLFGQAHDDPEPRDASTEPDDEPQEPSLGELQARNRELEIQAKERQAALDALIQARSPNVAPAAPQPRAPAPPQDPGPMPDPVDREAFERWISLTRARDHWEADQKLEGLRGDYERDDLAKRLWSRFQKDYPDQSEDEVLVTAAFHAVTGGRLPTDQAGQDRMLKDIADRLKGKAAPSSEPQPATIEPANRTGGLSRGSSAPRKQGKPKEEPVKTLMDSLGDRQVKSPFF